MATNLQFFPYKPIGGINGEDCEDSLGEFEVRDARNFLFERRAFISRPGVVGVAPSGLTGNINWMKSLLIESTPFTIVITSADRIYKLSSDYTTATEITSGGAVSFPGVTQITAEVVNGVVLIGGNPGGLVRWDTSGNTYTELGSGADFIFVTSHANRAVGVAKMSGAAGDSYRLAWSQSGDETAWTGGDSGTAHLIDAPDPFTGVGVLHNMLVIARREGFTIGRLTLGGSPVYEFETWSRAGRGVTYYTTLATHDNKMFYVSEDDVCIFDLRQVEAIGRNIRGELINLMRAGTQYKGFISKMYFKGETNTLRYCYHLAPIGLFGFTAQTLPHFIYDIESGVWSKHTYSFQPRGGFYARSAFDAGTPAVFDATKVYQWNPDLACESAMQLTGRVFTIGPEDVNMQLQRVLVKARNNGEQIIKVTGRAEQEDALVENEQIDTVGTTAADGRFRRAWFSMEGVVGQDFQVQLDVAANQKFEGNLLGMEIGSAGEFLGTERA